MTGPKPVGRWVIAWVCGVVVFVLVTLILGAEAAPDGFQMATADGAWARLAGLLLAAVAAGAVVPLAAGHDVPGLTAAAMGVGLVIVAQTGRSMMSASLAEPPDYWLYAVAETAAVVIALLLAYATSSAMIEKVVGVERREVWRRQVRVSDRRRRVPWEGIFLAMGAALLVTLGLGYALNGGQRGEGVAAVCMGATALAAAWLMHRAAPVRETLWFAISAPLWTALLPLVGWVIVEATGDEALPLAVAMSSLGTSPFAFCGAAVAGAMIGFWASYRG